MLNPISVIEMLLVGYLLAVGLQTLFGAGYTRLGRSALMTSDDRWSALYFALTGAAWVVTMMVVTFLVLPMAEVAGRKQSGVAAILLDLVLILVVLYRNRQQNPRQQSIIAMVLLSLCIVAGSVAGAMLRVHYSAAA